MTFDTLKVKTSLYYTKNNVNIYPNPLRTLVKIVILRNTSAPYVSAITDCIIIQSNLGARTPRRSNNSVLDQKLVKICIGSRTNFGTRTGNEKVKCHFSLKFSKKSHKKQTMNEFLIEDLIA